MLKKIILLKMILFLGAMVELAKEVYNVDVMAVIYYEGKQFSIPLDLLEPVSSKRQ